MTAVGAPQKAALTLGSLKQWLIEDAYPMWWTHGADHVGGGFHERLKLDAQPTGEPRRARVHPRQIYSYAMARELGWTGPADRAVGHALDFFLTHYARHDGLFRTLVASDGTCVNDRAVFYDQAFALLGLAYSYRVLGDPTLKQRARDLLSLLRTQFGHSLAGFEESKPRILPLLSNSHMHMLEASLAWADLDSDGPWFNVGEEIVQLALTCFFDPGTGFLLEFFDREWRPAAGVDGRIVEPGHQYEWAGLLLRWTTYVKNDRAQQSAFRLLELAETYGCDAERGVVMNTLLTDKGVRDAQARLWPQTEKMKAMCAAALFTGDERYWSAADDAARGLSAYLNTPVRGLWYDKMDPDGTLVEEPAPASSFYHIVCAIAEMDQALARVARRDP
jgi:mannose-6-phosphate isomerase